MAKNTRKAEKKSKKATRKGKRALSPALKAWNEKVMRVFRRERKGNPKFKLMDAMRLAKKEQ